MSLIFRGEAADGPDAREETGQHGYGWIESANTGGWYSVGGYPPVKHEIHWNLLQVEVLLEKNHLWMGEMSIAMFDWWGVMIIMLW